MHHGRNGLNTQLAMKEIATTMNKQDSIVSQLQVLDKIYEIFVPPKVFPKYYGFAKKKNAPGCAIYYLFFEFYPKNLRTLLNENPDQTLPFNTICHYFKDLINGLTYLETM